MSVVLKEEPGEKFESSYMEDICLGTFDKVFQPIDQQEVEFPDDMVYLYILSKRKQIFCNVLFVDTLHCSITNINFEFIIL